MATEIACPACSKPVNIYPPDNAPTRFSVTRVQNSIPQMFTCDDYSAPIATFWFS